MENNTLGLSPQQRWRNLQAKYIPTLTKRQQKLFVALSVILVLAFVLFVLPFLLPLAGPKPQSPQSLADDNGAFIEVEDTTIYYQHAKGNGPVVLLIHGQAGSTLTWRETLPSLHSAGYDVYALDLPGLGLSEKGLHINYSHGALAETVARFMEVMDISKAHIVAHAFSSNIAVILAQRYPTYVRSLVLVAPTIITTPTTQIPSTLLEMPFLERWIRVLIRWVLPEAVGEQLRSATKNDDVVDDELIADYSRVMKTEGWEFTALGMIRDSHLNAIDAPLETLNIPAAVVWGTQDGWAPPTDGYWIVEALSAEYYPLEGIGHLPMHEAVADFNAILMAFFDNIDSISE
ncbi:MAG: hypothetical protein CUN55_09160 [Phototrophicales bacterium]|nr:MAG: hypothetical protein CUN55_09160 [Phototrophicales bacterium]